MVNSGGLSEGELANFSGDIETYYGFEEANLPKWDTPGLDRNGNNTHSGSYAGYASNARGDGYQAAAAPFGGEEREAESVSCYIYETGASFGGGVRVANSNEQILCGWATDNPQWNIQSGNGTNYIYGGDGTGRWIYVEFTFDWENGNFDYYIEDTQSGTTKTGTEPLASGGSVAYFRIEDYTAGTWQDGGSIDMWVDDVVVKAGESAFTGGRSGGGLNNLTTDLSLNDFETGDLSKWKGSYTFDYMSVTTSRVFSGTYAGKTTGNLDDGVPHATRDLGELYQPKTVSWYFQESSNGTGGGLRLYNEDDDPVVGMASNNPEWVVYDATGTGQVDTGSTYNMWVYVEITFDWQNDQFDIFIERQDNNYSYSDTARPLNNPSGIRFLYLENYDSGGSRPYWLQRSDIEMWWDEIKMTQLW